MTKKITIITIGILILMVAGIISIINTYKVYSELSISELANQQSAGNYNRSNGNYIIRGRNNGISDFPYILGYQADLISIPDGQEYFISRSQNSNSNLGPTISGNTILYASKAILLPEKRKIDFSKFDLEFYGSIYEICDIFHDRYICFGKGKKEVEGEPDTYEKLYVLDITTNQKKAFYTGNVDVTSTDGCYLYYHDLDNGTIYRKNIIADEPSQVVASMKKKEEIVEMAVKKDILVLLYFGDKNGNRCDEIVAYNMKTKEDKLIANNGASATDVNWAPVSMHIKNNDLFYLDDLSNVYKVNLRGRRNSKRIISMKKDVNLRKQNILLEKSVMETFWCEDYVVIETNALGPKSMMSVYDYTGEYIRSIYGSYAY